MIATSTFVIELADWMEGAVHSYRAEFVGAEIQFAILEIHAIHGEVVLHFSQAGDLGDIRPQTCTHPNYARLERDAWYSEYERFGTLCIDGEWCSPDGGTPEVDRKLFAGFDPRLLLELRQREVSTTVETWMLLFGYTAMRIWRSRASDT